MGLLFGWLRAVAHGYNDSKDTIDSGSNFQKNLMSKGVKLGWGLDGCVVAQANSYSCSCNSIVK